MKQSNWRTWLTVGAVGGAALSAHSVMATEPLPEAHLKIRVEFRGNGLADVVVGNEENEPAEIDVSLAHHATIHMMDHVPIRPIHIGVPSHQEARGQFQFETPREGTMVVHFQSRVVLGNRKIKNGPMFYQVYQATPNGLKEVSYEQAFLTKRIQVIKPEQKSRPAELKLGGGFVAHVELERSAFKAHEMDAGTIQQIQPVRLGSPLEMADKYALKQLPAPGNREAATGVVFPTPFPGHPGNPGPIHPVPGHPGPIPIHTPGPGIFEMPNVEEDMRNLVTGFALERDDQGEMHAMNEKDNKANFTIKGHMSTKYDDGSFHGAWGWVVTAWQWDDIAGFNMFMPLGWTYVNGDGSWQIPLAGFANNHSQVYVQYQTANRFVQLQDPSGNVYTWGDWWNLTGANTDIGYRFADLSASGDLPGIDKLYEGATEEWSKFYYNGMNALRDQPIQVTYPNSLASGHCSETKDSAGNTVPKYAWSCSEWSSGKIWVIPAHGDKSVVQHEAAHSINSYYWNGNMPSGAGGAHSLDGCYNGGLALTEGFANFITYWTQFDRSVTSATASYFNEDIEAYNGDNSCSTGDINEMRVAATFWDMYDTHGDGPDANHQDTWNYINQAAPVSIFLNNGTKQKMSDYLPVVDAGDASWYAADRALFRLNRIIP